MESSLLLKASRDGDWQSHVVWSPGKVAEADYWLAGQFVTWLVIVYFEQSNKLWKNCNHWN